MSAPVKNTLLEYEQAASAWDATQSDARRANAVFDRMHILSNLLKQSEEGRRGLEGLLSHQNRGVRLAAAAVCLEWSPDIARPALRSLILPRGTHSLSAETTLREYDAGRLTFDW